MSAVRTITTFVAATLVSLALYLGLGINLTVALVGATGLGFFVLVQPLVGLVITIFTNVLSPLLGSFDFSGVGLTLPRAVGALTLGSWLVRLVWLRQRPVFTRQIIPLAFFLATVLLSVLTKPDLGQSMLGAYLLLVGLLFYVMISSLPTRPQELLLIVAVVWGVGLVSSTIGLVQYAVPTLEVLQPTEGGLDVSEGAVVDEDSVSSGPIRRVTGGLGDANQFAVTVVSVLPLGMFWWRYAPARPYRWLVIGVVLAQLVGMVLSYSRSGFIALGAAILYFTWKRLISPKLLLSLALGAGIVSLVWLPPGFIERMFSLSYLRQGSTNIRKDFLLDTIAITKEHWITGIGFGQLGPELYGNPRSASATDIAAQIDIESPEVHNTGAHNLILEVWVEYGIIGLIPYLLFLIVMMKEIQELSRADDALSRDLATSLIACFVAFFVCGLFGHQKALKVFWLLAGLSVCLRRFSSLASQPVEEGPPAGAALQPVLNH